MDDESIPPMSGQGSLQRAVNHHGPRREWRRARPRSYHRSGIALVMALVVALVVALVMALVVALVMALVVALWSCTSCVQSCAPPVPIASCRRGKSSWPGSMRCLVQRSTPDHEFFGLWRKQAEGWLSGFYTLTSNTTLPTTRRLFSSAKPASINGRGLEWQRLEDHRGELPDAAKGADAVGHLRQQLEIFGIFASAQRG